MTTAEIIVWLNRERTMLYNQERQEQSQRILDHYNGQHLDYLEAEMDKQFSKPEAMKLQMRVENLIEFVGDAISRVFDDYPEITSDDARVQEWLTNLDGLLPLVTKKAEVYKNLTRICAVHSWFDTVSQSIKHTILPNSVLFVDQDPRDANRAQAVVYTRTVLDTIGVPRIEYIHWDSETTFMWSAQDPAPRSSDPDLNPGMKNPYGIIPIVFYRDDIASANFFEEVDETLINAQLAINVERTTKAYQLKMQGFSQPVIVGHDGKSPVFIDPSRPICIPAAGSGETQGSFNFVTPDAKLGEIQGSIDEIRESVTKRFGITTDAYRNSASGYALKLMDNKLNRRRQDDLALSKQFLNDLFEVDRVIWNTHFPTQAIASGMSAKDFANSYQINFIQPDYADDPAKTQLLDKEDILLGVTTAGERLQRLKPDLSIEEADALISENLAKNSAYQKARQTYGLADLIAQVKAPVQSPVERQDVQGKEVTPNVS